MPGFGVIVDGDPATHPGSVSATTQSKFRVKGIPVMLMVNTDFFGCAGHGPEVAIPFKGSVKFMVCGYIACRAGQWCDRGAELIALHAPTFSINE